MAPPRGRKAIEGQEAQESVRADDPKAAPPKPERGPILRYFRRCTAIVDTLGPDGTACGYRTGSFPDTRRPELRYMEHALAAHSTPRVEEIVTRREAVEKDDGLPGSPEPPTE